MGLSDQIDNALQSLTSWVVVTLGGGLMWLIRRILTNERKIALLESYIEHRDKQRDEDREMMKEIGRKVDALYERGSK